MHTWIVAVHLIPNIFQFSVEPQKIRNISSPVLSHSGNKHAFLNTFHDPSFIKEIHIYHTP